MFTQCSKCDTVFRLSAEVLRAAGGQVRCGKCGEVFNALARLAEEPGAFASGESALELETRADSILETTPVSRPPLELMAEDGDPSQSQIARLEVQDWDDESADELEDKPEDESAALEFSLPPGELDRIFVENRQALHFLSTAAAQSKAAAESQTAEAGAQTAGGFQSAPDTDPDTDTHNDPDTDTYTHTYTDPDAKADAGAAADAVSDLNADAAAGMSMDLPLEAPAGNAGVDAAPPRRVGLELSEDLRRQVRDGMAQVEAPVLDVRPKRAIVPWLVAALLFVLALAGQLVHQNREWLAAREPFGDHLRAAYAKLGYPLPVTLILSAYQLRQWGVTGDPSAGGTLRVRASILNVAATRKPYPLLRVTLADRFGNRIGSRDFEPGEYLAKAPARLMAPGERADATLEIQDPGKSAEGFEFDVCLRSPEQRVLCANDQWDRGR